MHGLVWQQMLSIQFRVDAVAPPASEMPRPSTITSPRNVYLVSRDICSALLDRINQLWVKSTEVTVNAQERYMTTSDKKDRRVCSYDKDNLFYFQDDSLQGAKNLSKKLKPKKYGPFVVVAVTPKTVKIENRVIDNSVSINMVSLAQLRDKNNRPFWTRKKWNWLWKQLSDA